MNHFNQIQTKLSTSLLLLAFTLSTQKLQGQQIDSTINLVVIPLEISFVNNSNKTETDYPKIVADRIIEVLAQCNRFELIDRTELNIVQDEIALWKEHPKESLKDWDLTGWTSYGRQLKADFILTGSAQINCSTNLITGFWESEIDVFINVINVRTREIYFTKRFQAKSGSMFKRYNTTSDAIVAALGKIDIHLKNLSHEMEISLLNDWPHRSTISHTIAGFPWPPPRCAERYTLLQEFKYRFITLNAVDNWICNALNNQGYGSRSYYSLPNGFALVTRMEQFNKKNSKCLSEDKRWVAYPVNEEDGDIIANPSGTKHALPLTRRSKTV